MHSANHDTNTPTLSLARVLPRADIDARPSWIDDEYASFFRMVCTPEDPFPCFFAGEAEKRGELAYTWLDKSDIEEPRRLLRALGEFLTMHEYESPRAALIVFCDLPETRSPATALWHVLQRIHDDDPAPWPETVPRDPETARWSFCFRGTELFVNAHSAHYAVRRSRSSGCGLMIVIQRSSNFHLAGLVGATSPTKVQDRIREAVARYDGQPVHPCLTVPFEHPESRAWKMYFLPDRNEPVLGRCPLRIHGDEAAEGAAERSTRS